MSESSVSTGNGSETNGTVCIIGAGPGGIAAGKVFLEDGYDVTIYEKNSELGGTWSSENRYLNLNHQLPDKVTEFIGKPWGKSYAPAEEFQSYQESYAKEFGVENHIEFQTEVVKARKNANEWVIITQEIKKSRQNKERFDYLVVCSGAYDIPNRPKIADESKFHGEILHSSEVKSKSQLKNKKIAIIGGGKSAADIATESAKFSTSTAMIFRKANWFPPKKLWKIVPQNAGLYTRIGESVLPMYYNENTWRWMDRLLHPLTFSFLKLLENGVKVGSDYRNLPDDLVPDSSVLAVQRAGVMPDEFPSFIQNEEIQPIKGTVKKLDQDGIILDSGQKLHADKIILATGYRSEYPFLPESIRLKKDGDYYLYRGILPLNEDDIGILGRREVLNNFLSMNLSAHWLSDYFQGQLSDMPNKDVMKERIESRLAWMDENIPLHKGYYYGAYDIHTFDELLIDMGIPTRRSHSFATEWLGINARGKQYRGLIEERQADERESTPLTAASGVYLSLFSVMLAVPILYILKNYKVRDKR
ncbi:flavin-containing monooxygenase [Halocatena halophila]|uniref:flavin-containing monooxygenase n=1 Tax=Halocatena halophila TaxID=2814576 RepID=UPI002ED3EB53